MLCSCRESSDGLQHKQWHIVNKKKKKKKKMKKKKKIKNKNQRRRKQEEEQEEEQPFSASNEDSEAMVWSEST